MSYILIFNDDLLLLQSKYFLTLKTYKTMPKGKRNPSEMEKLVKSINEINVSKLGDEEVKKQVEKLKILFRINVLRKEIAAGQKELNRLLTEAQEKPTNTTNEDDAKPHKRVASE